ncbi:Hypothetical predicted protein [Cloeon dipterum]|uniref:Uncharacterized protein n=1 Tax=Cloeon dipterum TaxID=197152 RepID=A0A8S1E7L4_9INSE|nr:Hypothetical predicted protein [Cloeon dipterum]
MLIGAGGPLPQAVKKLLQFPACNIVERRLPLCVPGVDVDTLLDHPATHLQVSALRRDVQRAFPPSPQFVDHPLVLFVHEFGAVQPLLGHAEMQQVEPAADFHPEISAELEQLCGGGDIPTTKSKVKRCFPRA